MGFISPTISIMITIGTGTYSEVWRGKYRSAEMQKVLRNNLVAADICEHDESNSYYIHNPYGSQPTATLQAQTGTYSVSTATTTDDALTVNNEVIYSEHIFDFERLLSNYDLFRIRTEEMAYAIAAGVDKYVLNNLCEDATSSLTTAAGGFSTPSNVLKIFADCLGKVAGYAGGYGGYAMVVENTDISGILQNQAQTGFQAADRALANGMGRNNRLGSILNVDIYVVRTGTFVDDTLAGEVVTNSRHRVFTVKGVSTYATPGGVRQHEIGVTGKTGKEIAVWQHLGFKLWTQMAPLAVDITLA